MPDNPQDRPSGQNMSEENEKTAVGEPGESANTAETADDVNTVPAGLPTAEELAEALVQVAEDQAEAAPAEQADDELTRLRTAAAQAEDRVLRAQAELDNVRKRSQREVVEARKFAAMPLVRELLTVSDNLDRAIAAAEEADHNTGLLEGIKMVAQQLHTTLENHGCKRIEADGQPFDPHLHEAISQQPSADHAPGTVMHVVLNGYELHSRVVRPAQVIVAAEPPAEEPQETAGDGEDDS